MTFEQNQTDQTVTWITDVDEERMWKDFLSVIDEYQRTHKVRTAYSVVGRNAGNVGFRY